ncbi:PepSY domain-containing protein [Blastopirellula sp. J2-11]|uniref:PepSY-associated TM helix domain-containing protein n=1 Tax=Blastopirellula sp. J2-11 TaxID=2943192 RepID=UPI0021C69C0B|nr:PepSY domain-containing protein [Blastopirellula sp. J2-11]UUO07480.1 PepSY domain-containing protein [Blastopirellula sp. J2-11]
MSPETIENRTTFPTSKASVAKATPARRTLFRVFWRWHFYAGLIVSPFILVVALTGAIYLFGAEISDIANQDFLFVESVGTVAAYPALIESAEASIPAGKATRISTFADPRRTVIVSVKSPQKEPEKETTGRRRRSDRGSTVYVDPYSATVLQAPQGPKKLDSFFRLVLKIHRQLFVGTPGRIIVELATCWTLVLFVTGFYLWWPRSKAKSAGVWTVRWTAKRYTLLRDLHAIVAAYLTPVCLVILITGLFYTLVWGESFHFVTQQFFTSAVETNSRKKANAKEDYVPPLFAVQDAVDKSRLLYPDRDITVTLPSQATDHYEVSAINDYARGTYGAMNSTGFQLHRETGEVLEVSDLSQNERFWWHTWAYPLHVGSVVGWTSKVIWLLACIALMGLPITGLWMWWIRRPQGKTGFPRKPNPQPTPLWLAAAILTLCLILPAFGLSVLLIVLLEWTMARFRRLPGRVAKTGSRA